MKELSSRQRLWERLYHQQPSHSTLNGDLPGGRPSISGDAIEGRKTLPVSEEVLRDTLLSRTAGFGEVLVVLGRIISAWEAQHKELRDLTETLNQEKIALQHGLQELEREIQRMRHLATRDPLTDLPNRRLFEENLRFAVGRARRHDEPLSLAILDIDHFKQYNDTHGHIEGDRLLKALGDLLYQLSRHDSDVVARYGGEEFALILTNTPAAGAMRMAERIRQAVERTLPCTVSIGLTTFGGRMKDFHDLVRAADKALYRAKHEGRNRIVVVESTHEEGDEDDVMSETNGR
ncbi:MAG: GGDEF domain-containing protein [Abditibacteriales bacterium]|nr:GGDEF domain-containing protein [Abditibacteriales bacterium]MDW8367642.1 GGDEF domain-containing protein [Abditibacteriales bacterium]